MNVLFFSAHPAQVHNFRCVRDLLIRDGHQVFWMTTQKDIATQLLERYHIPYMMVSKPKKNILSQCFALITNTWYVLRYMRSNHIDIVISRTCPFTAMACKILHKPHVIFSDTEHATTSVFQKPFARMSTDAIMPNNHWVELSIPAIRIAANKELFYLHPKLYTPQEPWSLLGIEPNTRYALVRFVKWDAYHDTKLVGGFSLSQKEELIRRLAQHVRVFISSETELPAALEPYRIHIPIERMHDVQAFAQLFVGESSTMASESICLGTPAIYVDEIGRGYTDEEARAGLLWMYRPYPCQYRKNISHIVAPDMAWQPQPPYKDTEGYEPFWIQGGIEEAIERAEYMVSPQFDYVDWKKRYQKWLATKINPAAWLTWFIENYPSSAQQCADSNFDWSRYR